MLQGRSFILAGSEHRVHDSDMITLSQADVNTLISLALTATRTRWLLADPNRLENGFHWLGAGWNYTERNEPPGQQPDPTSQILRSREMALKVDLVDNGDHIFSCLTNSICRCNIQ